MHRLLRRPRPGFSSGVDLVVGLGYLIEQGIVNP